MLYPQFSYTDVNRTREEDKDLLHTYEQVLFDAKRSVAIVTLDYKIVWINKTAIDTFGYSLEECLGKRISELIFGKETDPQILETAVNAIDNFKTTSYDHIAYRKDGSKIWIGVTLKPLYNRKNEIDKYCIYGSDITKQKEEEERVAQSEQKHKQLLDSIAEIIIELDTAFNVVFVNQAWTKTLGFELEETIGRSYLDFLSEEQKEKVLANDYLIRLDTSRKIKREAGIFTKDKKLKWFEIKSEPTLTALGEVNGYTGIFRDITEEKRNAHYYELLSNNIKDLIGVHDEHTNYLYVSPSIKQIAGYDPEEILGKPSFSFYHPDDIPKVTKFRNSNIRNANNPQKSIVLRYRKKDESYTWLELSAKWFYDEYSGAWRTITSGRIADDRVREEEKIQAVLAQEKKLNKLKSNFVSIISHEFRTPLAIIKAVCELLKMQIEAKTPGLEEQLAEDLVAIETEINGLTSLIDDVLILEKIETGDVTLNCKPIEMRSLILPIIHRLAIKHKDRKEILFNIIGTPKLLYGDVQYLEIVFSNLLSNAYKYSKGKPEPIVTVTYMENDVIISIKDFGIGIPERNMKKLFTDFFRGDNVRDTEGTGLGLSIAKKFVEMHDGKIICNSKENEGTEMIVSLPICKDELI